MPDACPFGDGEVQALAALQMSKPSGISLSKTAQLSFLAASQYYWKVVIMLIQPHRISRYAHAFIGAVVDDGGETSIDVGTANLRACYIRKRVPHMP